MDGSECNDLMDAVDDLLDSVWGLNDPVAPIIGWGPPPAYAAPAVARPASQPRPPPALSSTPPPVVPPIVSLATQSKRAGKRVSFSDETRLRTLTVNDDDVRSLTSLLSAGELDIHLTNKTRHANGFLPLDPHCDSDDDYEY
jgi:hypothetical protein